MTQVTSVVIICDSCKGTSGDDRIRKWVTIEYGTNHNSYRGEAMSFVEHYCCSECAIKVLKRYDGIQGREKMSIKDQLNSPKKVGNSSVDEVLNHDGNVGSMVPL